MAAVVVVEEEEEKSAAVVMLAGEVAEVQSRVVVFEAESVEVVLLQLRPHEGEDWHEVVVGETVLREAVLQEMTDQKLSLRIRLECIPRLLLHRYRSSGNDLSSTDHHVESFPRPKRQNPPRLSGE